MPIFSQNVITMIWVFDKTLIPGYMQKPLFERFDIDPIQFWAESEAPPSSSATAAQGSRMATRSIGGSVARFPQRSRARTRGELTFYEGIPEFPGHLSKHIEGYPADADHGISVEHNVISSGLRQMILASAVAPFLDAVWACE